MPLIAALSRDFVVPTDPGWAAGGRFSQASTGSLDRLFRLVRERPVSAVALEYALLARDRDPAGAVVELRKRFPSVGLVLLAEARSDPQALFRMGKVGIDALVPAPWDRAQQELFAALARALRRSAPALVTRAVSPYLPRREVEALRWALDAPSHGWRTERFAQAVGLTRAHLSVRLKEVGLPSAGHLLVWSRMLHAGLWLTDPGRSGESISRQLEYSSGAAFRRALRSYVGTTPTGVAAGGGFSFVLSRFLRACALGGRGAGRSAA
ncbi:MAG: helix-turn-helix domain-containing protein [Gemmatimonadota bacterium]